MKARISVVSPKLGSTSDNMTRCFAKSVQDAVKAHQAKGQPVARYDAAKRKAYLEYPNGETRYVE